MVRFARIAATSDENFFTTHILIPLDTHHRKSAFEVLPHRQKKSSQAALVLVGKSKFV